MRRTLFLTFAASALSLSGSIQVNSSEPHRVVIDSGTVEVRIVDSLPSSEPVELTYRAQGHCQPELSIQTHGDLTRVEHIQSCHGRGRDEGTIMTLLLRRGSDYRVELRSGRVEVSARDELAGVRQFVGEVAVGGIRGPGKPEQMVVRRSKVVGARTQLSYPDGSGKLEVRVRYGEVRIN